MLNQPSVLSALDSKRDSFYAFDAEQRQQQRTFETRLSTFNELDSQAILDQLIEAGIDWPGARPTAELDEADNLCLSFTEEWRNHQEARAWARAVLKDRTTIAVDGSQIVPSLEYLPLVGAIQVGWFVNDHRAQADGDGEGGSYVKDLAFQVLAPHDLQDEEDGDDESVATQTVNQVRFVAECEKLCELMRSQASSQHAGSPSAPLSFFDGSFIISFAGKIREARAAQYIGAVQKLLDDSLRYRRPLVGFVDSSRSRDIVSLVNTLEEKEKALTISDGMLLNEVLARWGDRTPLFICARHDGLSSTSRAAFYGDVLFCYMRLGRDRAPARVEMPRWMYEAGLANDILDMVRAECVVGTGYPYAIETADALAVISQQDRRRFYAILQRFMHEQGFLFTQTRKSQSKRVRR